MSGRHAMKRPRGSEGGRRVAIQPFLGNYARKERSGEPNLHFAAAMQSSYSRLSAKARSSISAARFQCAAISNKVVRRRMSVAHSAQFRYLRASARQSFAVIAAGPSASVAERRCRRRLLLGYGEGGGRGGIVSGTAAGSMKSMMSRRMAGSFMARSCTAFPLPKIINDVTPDLDRQAVALQPAQPACESDRRCSELGKARTA